MSRFVALGSRKALLFVEGVPCEKETPEDLNSLPRVSHCPASDTQSTIDLGLLSRVVFPTYIDHSLAALCAKHAIQCDSEARAIGQLFGVVIGEALSFDIELIDLLSNLLPHVNGAIFKRMPRLLSETKSPERREEPPAAAKASGMASVQDILSQRSMGAHLGGYENRAGQQEMAELVEETLEAGGTLMAEAGPGTGKTFAYLIPAILLMESRNDSRMVVSTRTKQLQEQLHFKDLPFLVSLIAPALRTAMLKGRENYICLRRWQLVLEETAHSLERDLLPLLASLATWLFRTETGDIDENSVFLSESRGRNLWYRLRVDPKHCLGALCPFFERCYSFAARRRAKEARIVIVNHSLLLADARANHGIIGDYDYLIVDEAHSLEGAARQSFTESFTERGVEGLVAEIERSAGLKVGTKMPASSHRDSDTERAARARELGKNVASLNRRLFKKLRLLLSAKRRDRIPPLEEVRSLIERIVQTGALLQAAVLAIGEESEDVETARSLELLATEFGNTGALYAALLSPEQPNAVHWYDRTADDLSMNRSPLEVGPILAETLYPGLKGLVLTSATLSARGNFEYVCESLRLASAPSDLKTRVLDDRLAGAEHMRLYMPTFLSPVDGSEEAYSLDVADLARRVTLGTRRKTMVLFTSYSLMHKVRRWLRDKLPVFSQGVDGPRSKVIERFTACTGGAVLLGTDSFWEGIDLPGENLEILIITRLPFPVPTDPILSALGERLSSQGKDPFLDLSLPMAVLKLRQGAGRLLRTGSDRGALIITDYRIVARDYATLFTDPFSVEGFVTDKAEELLADIETWFESPTDDLRSSAADQCS